MSKKLEQHIVELLKVEDKKAISLIYKNYSDALYGVISKIIRDPDLAQDVLQESFIKVWGKAKTYDASKAKLFYRAKLLDKQLALPAGSGIMMSMGEQQICTRLNLLVSLLTLILDEVVE